MRTPVNGHAFGQHLYRPLAGHVGRDIRAAYLALHRTDVDDLAALARYHFPRDGLSYQEDAVDVRAHQFVPVLFRKILQGHAFLHAGVVDQNIDGTNARFNVFNRRPDSPCLRDIEIPRVHLKTFAAQDTRCLFEPGAVASVEHQRSAGLAQSARQREAYAA